LYRLPLILLNSTFNRGDGWRPLQKCHFEKMPTELLCEFQGLNSKR
jgi:hypothetical protein